MNLYLAKLIISLFWNDISILKKIFADELNKCKTSSDCSLGSCCRDENGQAIVSNEGSWWFPVPLGQEGTCSSQLGVEGDMCDYNCGCQDGYLFVLNYSFVWHGLKSIH